MNRRSLLALAAPALLFFAPALLLGRALYLRDTGLYFYPHKLMAAQALRAGRLPQWNPQEFGGLPFLADPNFNVFHPLSLLTVLLPMPLGFTLQLLACALLAGFGARLAARRLGASEAGALVAALAFAWSGPFLSVLEGGQVVAAAFLPWLCAAALGEAVAPVAAAAALIFLSGTPEIGGCALLLGLLLAPRKRRYLLAAALGAGVAAVQLLPTALFLHESSRAGGFALGEAAMGAMRLQRLPELLSAALATVDPATTYLEAIHLGLIPLLLAALALRGRARLWVPAAALLLLALGSSTPLYAMAWKALPPLQLIRYPEKLLVPVAFLVALLAGLGWDALPRWKPVLAALLLLELGWPAALLDRTVPAAELTAPAPLAAEIERDAAAAPWSYRVDVQPLGVRDEDLQAIGEPGWPRARRMFWLRQQALFGSGAAAAAGLHLGRGYSGFTPGAMRDYYRHGARALDLLAVRYGVDFGTPGKPSPYEALGFTPLGPRAAGLARLWRNPRALPRLRLVATVLPRGAGGGPVPCEAVWLPAGELAAARGLLAPDCSRAAAPAGVARIVSFEPERVEAKVEAAAAALVVLADTFAGGWAASVDGAPATLLHADGVMRAVAVPSGSHLVVFQYRAPGIIAGTCISVFSLALLIYVIAGTRGKSS